MRKLLATAVALGPLMAAAGAHAQEVVIDNTRTTPVATATAGANGAASNVRLTSNGDVNVASGAAITLNSNNTVDLDTGAGILMQESANGSTGILVQGGRTGQVIVGGAVNVQDQNTGSDADKAIYGDIDGDGDGDGPLAEGLDRYGVRVTGGSGPFTGSVLIENTGSIAVEGERSYGISVESGLVGDLRVIGGVNVVGDESYAVRTTGDVQGTVLVTGSSISAQGENAVGLAVDGDVSGRVQIQGGVNTSGYRYPTPPAATPDNVTDIPKETLLLEDLDADDLLQAGPAVRISGNVAGGVLLDTGPTDGVGGLEGDEDKDGVKNGDEDNDGDGTKNRDDTDDDADGILDAFEGTATVTSRGAAPAILIGSTTESVTLGAVGTGEEAYGFINRGVIQGSGVYDGVSGTGLSIGGLGQAVTVAGGIYNDGTVGANANGADSTSVRLGAGVTTPTFSNPGLISAQSVTEGEHTAVGLQIDAGAALPSFVNGGQVVATLGGEAGGAVAIRDLSGSLTSITNNGVLSATVIATDDDDDDDDDNLDIDDETITGEAIALDLAANTSGVTITQAGLVLGDRSDFDNDGTYDPQDADDDNDGTPDAEDDADNDDDNDGVYDVNEPSIVGDIRLGSGADVLDVRNGAVTGDIAFGAGADRLSITGGAVVRGALSDADGLLDIDVQNGVLEAQQTTALSVTGLNVGADGELLITLDPEAGAVTGFDVNGTATIAQGAGLGVRFGSLLGDDAERFTIIRADALNYGGLDQSAVQENSPYLFVVDASADVAAGEVYIDARRRTAAEAELTGVEVAAFDAVYDALDGQDVVRDAFLAQTDREGFVNLYEQMLPDHSGGPLLSLASGVDAVTRALTGRNASAAPGQTSAWVQEINFYADKDRTDTYGFRSEGFGVAGGVERGTNVGAFGLSVAFTSSDLEDPEAEAEEVLSANLIELGLYWRAQGQYWTTWARAAAGYATFDATRQLVGDGLNLRNESDWNGFTLALSGGASYERSFGRLSLRPEVYGEYFSLSEDAREEQGGGDGFDLLIDERDGHIFSAVAAMNVGYSFGNGWLKPELRLGWRQNLSVDAGETVARFASGGPDFTLSPASIEGGGPIVGFRLNVGNELGMLSITGDAEMLEDYVRYALLLRASFRF